MLRSGSFARCEMKIALAVFSHATPNRVSEAGACPPQTAAGRRLFHGSMRYQAGLFARFGATGSMTVNIMPRSGSDSAETEPP